MDQPHILISVVDDNESIREALPDLLRTMGFDAESFGAAETFLSSDCVDRSQCLILDVSLPGMSGPELQPFAPQELQPLLHEALGPIRAEQSKKPI
jgi:FixJ family two-component response regulator